MSCNVSREARVMSPLKNLQILCSIYSTVNKRNTNSYEVRKEGSEQLGDNLMKQLTLTVMVTSDTP